MEEECIELDNETTCNVCYAEFLDTDDLKLHVLQYHLNETNIQRYCKFCCVIFSDITAFALHIRDVHLTTIKSCRYCLRLFNDVESLSTHETKHKTLKFYPKISCSHCTKVFDEKNGLEDHETKDHSVISLDDEGMMLQYCFPELSAVIRMNIRTLLKDTQDNLNNYKCSCFFETGDLTEYISHLNDKKCRTLVCSICCKVYNKKYSLEYHITTHFTSQNLKKTKPCPKCNNNFSIHKLNVHMKKCRAMACVTCGISFDSLEKYAAHGTTHSVQVNCVNCKYCRRFVVGIDVLKKHIEKVHKPILHMYKYYCLPCEKVFKHPKLLFGHFFSKHKDIEPFTCKICDKKFRLRKNFTLHIKIEHKSVGFVEFDSNYHVFFTEKKSEKPFEPKNLDLDNSFENNEKGDKPVIELDVKNEKNKKMDEPSEVTDKLNDEINKSEKDITNDNPNSSLETIGPVEYAYLKPIVTRKRKSKRLSQPVRKSRRIQIESSDSDTPLSKLTNKEIHSKRKKYVKSSQVKKFVCKTCDRNCYTYQNYHRHMSLHVKNKPKTCIKCFATFKTKDGLNMHMKTKHSHSGLTETLKKMLDKRKSDVTINTKPSQANLFRKTIHKVPREKSNTQATIIVVENDQSPVKKFLENFQPESAESNVNNIIKVDIKQVKADKKEPLIKMKKFTPERAIPDSPQLRLPTKFTNELYEKPRVSVKLVRCEYVTSSISLEKIPPLQNQNEVIEETYAEIQDNIFDHYDDNRTDIPEASQEIELEGSDDRPKVVNKSIVLDNMLPTNDIVIGHLSDQAPYFKIVKMNDVLTPRIPPEQPSYPKVTLPNGMKLVSVNPLAHLLDKSNIDINKKSKYKPKLHDVSQAIVKAMKTLETVPLRKVKKKNS